jgi:hypothetical protein
MFRRITECWLTRPSTARHGLLPCNAKHSLTDQSQRIGQDRQRLWRISVAGRAQTIVTLRDGLHPSPSRLLRLTHSLAHSLTRAVAQITNTIKLLRFGVTLDPKPLLVPLKFCT